MELLPSEVSYSGRQETEAWRLRSSQQRERLPCRYPPFHLVSTNRDGKGMALSHAPSNLRKRPARAGRRSGGVGGSETGRARAARAGQRSGGVDERDGEGKGRRARNRRRASESGEVEPLDSGKLSRRGRLF